MHMNLITLVRYAIIINITMELIVLCVLIVLLVTGMDALHVAKI